MARTFDDQCLIDEVLYEATDAQQYSSVFPLMTTGELQVELDAVSRTLETYRGVVARNVENGFDGTATVVQQRARVTFEEVKIALLQAEIVSRS